MHTGSTCNECVRNGLSFVLRVAIRVIILQIANYDATQNSGIIIPANDLGLYAFILHITSAALKHILLHTIVIRIRVLTLHRRVGSLLMRVINNNMPNHRLIILRIILLVQTGHALALTGAEANGGKSSQHSDNILFQQTNKVMYEH
jgi:hypothetical protein